MFVLLLSKKKKKLSWQAWRVGEAVTPLPGSTLGRCRRPSYCWSHLTLPSARQQCVSYTEETGKGSGHHDISAHLDLGSAFQLKMPTPALQKRRPQMPRNGTACDGEEMTGQGSDTLPRRKPQRCRGRGHFQSSHRELFGCVFPLQFCRIM